MTLAVGNLKHRKNASKEGNRVRKKPLERDPVVTQKGIKYWESRPYDGGGYYSGSGWWNRKHEDMRTISRPDHDYKTFEYMDSIKELLKDGPLKSSNISSLLGIPRSTSISVLNKLRKNDVVVMKNLNGNRNTSFWELADG